MSPLVEKGQSDFGAGVQLEVARHLIAPNGFAGCTNGLLADDGSVFKRGGSERFAIPMSESPGKFIWEGQMPVGRRTFVATAAQFGVTPSDAANTIPVVLGGSGFPTVPKTAVYFQNFLWIGGGTLYGGSRKAADYSTGTVAVTLGSKVVTGSGTTWSAANVDVGMILRFSSTERAYVVAAVNSNTQIELAEAYEGTTGSGKAYALTRLTGATGPYKSAPFYAVAGERLICMNGRRIDFSEPNKPHLFKATIYPQETVVENFHELTDPVTILGGFTVGVDKLVVCHTEGIKTISNLAKSIVDGNGNSQHRIDTYSRDVVLWANPGICASKGTWILPAIDNIYLVDGTSAPKPIADAIVPLYRRRLLEGFSLGDSWVARETLFLPIIDASGKPLEVLACRLDKPYSYRNKELYPWTFLTGSGANVVGGVVRHPQTASELPRMLAMCSDGWVIELLGFFEPDEGNAFDHDGTIHPFELLTRDLSGEDEAIHRWRRLQLFYELWPLPAGSVDPVTLAPAAEPTISVEVGTGIPEKGLPLWDEVNWDEFEWGDEEEGEFKLLEGQAPANAGLAGQIAQNEKVWMMNTRARYVRLRFVSAEAAAKLIIRGYIIFPAEVGGVRHSRLT